MTDQSAFQVFVDGEIVPGLMFYGLDRPDNPHDVVFPRHLWRGLSPIKMFVLGGERWRVHLWEIALEVVENSAAFGQIIDATLESLLSVGCAVAWVGVEGNFCDPPNLFSPDCMSNGVFALQTPRGRRWNSFMVPGEWNAAPDELLREIRGEAILLAGAES